ncbi:hypothetical protein [Pseudonocardia sp. GCM10023141]|uniref:hypothetical protein n=1 Tax=Pseudonocardia sp. GCM10023141 TaxID=3252653 RepID=UPI00360F0F31
MTRLVLLGPQRRPTLGHVVETLELAGPVVTVTAGWQEREPDDAELTGLLGGTSTNLALHARWLDVLERDPDFAVAERSHRAALAQLQELYLLQLDGALRALAEIDAHGGPDPVRALVRADAAAAVRDIDERHLTRVALARADFGEAWPPAGREAIAEHRAQVAGVLDGAAALAVAGGHVGVLLHLLRLFAVGPRVPGTVIAWSAGAMALTDRVLLFHDRAPHGPTHPEFLDAGLGVLPGCVLLPHARRRLQTDDHARLAVLASRTAPARLVVLDDGVRVDLGAGGALPAGARVVAADGRIEELVS